MLTDHRKVDFYLCLIVLTLSGLCLLVGGIVPVIFKWKSRINVLVASIPFICLAFGIDISDYNIKDYISDTYEAIKDNEYVERIELFAVSFLLKSSVRLMDPNDYERLLASMSYQYSIDTSLPMFPHAYKHLTPENEVNISSITNKIKNKLKHVKHDDKIKLINHIKALHSLHAGNKGEKMNLKDLKFLSKYDKNFIIGLMN